MEKVNPTISPRSVSDAVSMMVKVSGACPPWASCRRRTAAPSWAHSHNPIRDSTKTNKGKSVSLGIRRQAPLRCLVVFCPHYCRLAPGCASSGRRVERLRECGRASTAAAYAPYDATPGAHETESGSTIMWTVQLLAGVSLAVALAQSAGAAVP